MWSELGMDPSLCVQSPSPDSLSEASLQEARPGCQQRPQFSGANQPVGGPLWLWVGGSQCCQRGNPFSSPTLNRTATSGHCLP